ncbi:FAS1 domain-containing protein [Lophiotrema nucula]|uniref:FAS1 domain-containing protein n=1 Tax=Lophiotrema nucula TaxID=690887 RepID=A0A6A5YZM3_9PLEO|nr:FAS1 domain-containing protein [Lophiotrema nucula]
MLQHNDQTILQILRRSLRFSRYSELLHNQPKMEEILDNRHQNLTLFLPTDVALEQVRDRLDSRAAQQIEDIVRYHIVPWPIATIELVCTPTLPTLLLPDHLNGPQRLKVALQPDGLFVDGHAHVELESIRAVNGYIHVIDALLQPPQDTAMDLMMALPPSEFGIAQYAFSSSGIVTELLGLAFIGATIFVPSNRAFLQLGNERLRHLLSTYGRDELRSLLGAHITLNQTLYSNAYYERERTLQLGFGGRTNNLCPSGIRWFRLHTLRSNVSHQVQVFRLARLIEIFVDGYVPIIQRDIVAKDGVVQTTQFLLAG